MHFVEEIVDKGWCVRSEKIRGPPGPRADGRGAMRFAALAAPRLAGCQDGCGLVPRPHIPTVWHFFRPGECRKLSGESPSSNVLVQTLWAL